jgi:hypothetical protein
MPASSQLTLNSVVCRGRDQISSNVEGDMAIMSIAKGNYYMLNEVGARFWELIDEPRRIADVCQILLDEYEAEREQCERETIRLAQELLEHDLVEVVDATDP